MRRIQEFWQNARHRDDGVYALELLGVFPVFFMVAAMAFQLASVGGAMNMAENAARNGSRMMGVGGDPRAAAMASIDPNLIDHASVTIVGPETVRVQIDVPIIIPFIDRSVATITRSATLPDTSGVY